MTTIYQWRNDTLIEVSPAGEPYMDEGFKVFDYELEPGDESLDVPGYAIWDEENQRWEDGDA